MPFVFLWLNFHLAFYAFCVFVFLWLNAHLAFCAFYAFCVFVAKLPSRLLPFIRLHP